MRTILNTTFNIDTCIEESWLFAMQCKYIPQIRDTLLCEDIVFTRMMVEEESGISFSLQLIFQDEERYALYVEKHYHPFLRAISNAFQNRMVYFSTTLKEIDYK